MDSWTRPDPVVLVHGLCGFDRLFARRRPAKEFFPGVATHLRSAGHEVFCPRISPTGSIEVRAQELKTAIQHRFGQRAIHLVGHSLGGLDSRFLVSRLGFENQCLSLTTIGTPHRGTVFADWIVTRFARLFRPVFRRLGIPDDAFWDLTTDACAKFAEETPDVPGMRTTSIAGFCVKPWLGAEWMFPANIVSRHEGLNDGVVSVSSATWGQHHETWEADHLNLVNWPNRFMVKAGSWKDRAQDYARIVQQTATNR
jgi:triacylglycerol lipase